MLAQGIIRRDDIAEIVVNIQQEVDQAFDFVEKSPFQLQRKPLRVYTGRDRSVVPVCLERRSFG